MKVNQPGFAARMFHRPGLFYLALLAALLTLLFWRSFLPDYVHFANDGPLGQQNTQWSQPNLWFQGTWTDLNSLGNNGGAATPDFVQSMRWVFGPVGFSKFYAPLSIFILGLCTWAFFRALKLTPLACALGGIAMCLNTAFFSAACWGVGAQEIGLGMVILALALVIANANETPRLIRWTRLALAGLCVGINVTESADIGALCSVFAAIFIFYKALAEENCGWFAKVTRGIGRVAVVAIFAGFIAIQTVVSLVSTQIEGVAGTAQNSETKAEHWDWATQWSLPKLETLSFVVPGLFGYRMDTPANMLPQLQPAYQGGVYWGGMGRSPEIDRFIDSGAAGTPPAGMMRFSGGGDYCGILVALLAAWAVAQSFRRQNSPFSLLQKRLIWFWLVVLVLSLLVAWGRFAPIFYGLLYQLPYFSTIRNPAKFIIFFCWALVVLFAYGVHALSQRQQASATAKPAGLVSQLQNWWARASRVERNWTMFCVGTFCAGVVSWLIYSAKTNSLVAYLQKMGFSDENFAKEIAAFSLGQLGWFVCLLAIAMVLVTLIIAGYFSGPRAKIGGALLGGFLLFDLGRANLPYIIHWDYKQKYEVGSLNPIVEFLRQQPYEHRVAKLLPAPLSTPSQFGLFDQLYEIEWKQHHFPYYNIQTLDIIQMSRMPEDLKAYTEALRMGIIKNADGQFMLDENTFPRLTRQWELSNTRYLLGPAGFIDLFNTQFDPGQHRFRIIQRFEVAPKPGILQPTDLTELTAVPNENGRYALFEFTGALPRAKLYSNWLVNTNDQANLKVLADQHFNPAKTVLISTPPKNLPAVATNENSGTVEFKSYAPTRLVFTANAATPSILLLNDKYDPNWRVTVDGQPAELLRCNFLMRGVPVPPGQHTVEFDFRLPSRPLYVTLAAIGIGLCLTLWLLLAQKRASAAKH